MTKPLLERFWERVSKDDPSGCWIWIGAHSKEGYGQLSVAGRLQYAHRVSFDIAHGRPPIGRLRHACDTPQCVNPQHLLEGTSKDNTHDMLRRERMKRKLTWEEVRRVRALYATGLITQRELARAFKVTQRVVSRIVRGESWDEIIWEEE